MKIKMIIRDSDLHGLPLHLKHDEILRQPLMLLDIYQQKYKCKNYHAALQMWHTAEWNAELLEKILKQK